MNNNEENKQIIKLELFLFLKEFEVQNIFKFITCGINLDFYSEAITIFKEQNPFFNSYTFEDLNNFFKELFKLNELSFDKNYHPYLISNERYKNFSSGIYSYKIGNEIEKEIINITFTLSNNVPIVSSILFYTQYTRIEEIISFYKCLYIT